MKAICLMVNSGKMKVLAARKTSKCIYINCERIKLAGVFQYAGTIDQNGNCHEEAKI